MRRALRRLLRIQVVGVFALGGSIVFGATRADEARPRRSTGY